MKMKYNSEEKKWNHPVAEMLPRHDVVFRSPVCDPTYGMPLGNGDLGTLLWISEEELHLQINKTDLWDDTKREDDVCSWELENLTVCRSGVHLRIKFGCPIFENIYQKAFEGRLSLSDATAEIKAHTPFAESDIRAFVSEKYNTAVLEVDAEYKEAAAVRAVCERWGSRSFARWYSDANGGPEDGLGGTEVFCENNTLFLAQELNGAKFCAAIRIEGGEGENKYSKLNSNAAECAAALKNRHRMVFYAAIAVGESMEKAKKAAEEQVEKAQKAGIGRIYSEHKKSWEEFWEKSFICLPRENDYDYMENLWYLNLYYANCQMRGKYPAHFCNGVWNFYHDFVPWNNFFHYNMQLATFPLEAANHPELLETYYNFRINQYPAAKRFTEKYLKMPGVFYTDVCDRFGRNDPTVSENCTCAAQIAMALYAHYQYSKDAAYLKNKVLPIMKAVGEFYLEKLKLGEDGLYHIHKTQGYEGSPLFDDSITDMAMIRVLFKTLAKELEEGGREYKERLEKLAPYYETDFSDGETENGRFARGIGKGMKVRIDKVLSVGKECSGGKLMRRTFGDPENDYYGFPDTEMAPLFPSGTVGIKDRGERIYDLIYNSICLHHPAIPPNETGEEFDGLCMHWCLMPIYAARMGMTELLEKQLRQTISLWIRFPQGFNMEAPYEDFYLYTYDRWAKYEVDNAKTGKKELIPGWKFRHFDYETLPIVAAAMNEMLIQSYDGILRLFPAWNTEKYASFRLAAVGGYKVNAAVKNGECSVYVECEQNGIMNIAFENISKGIIFADESGSILSAEKNSGGVYSLEVKKGAVCRAYTNGWNDGFAEELSEEKNNFEKSLGRSKLGCN